jgi:DNA-binding MarR family transcriptional regulator
MIAHGGKQANLPSRGPCGPFFSFALPAYREGFIYDRAMARTKRAVSRERSELRENAIPAESAMRVLRQFRRVFNAVQTHFRRVEKQAGLGGAQLWALSVIAAQPDIGVGGLAKAMDVHQTTASNLVKQLLAAGLVASERTGRDRRTVQLRALPAGRRVLRRVPGPSTGVLPQALARLDSRTLARLDRDLGVLVKLLQVDPRAARTPLAQT